MGIVSGFSSSPTVFPSSFKFRSSRSVSRYGHGLRVFLPAYYHFSSLSFIFAATAEFERYLILKMIVELFYFLFFLKLNLVVVDSRLVQPYVADTSESPLKMFEKRRNKTRRSRSESPQSYVVSCRRELKNVETFKRKIRKRHYVIIGTIKRKGEKNKRENVGRRRKGRKTDLWY